MPIAKRFLVLLLALPFGLGAAAPPSWVQAEGADPAYPASRYLTGYGLSSPGGTGAEQRAQALAMAKEALVSSIRTRVTSEFTARVTQQDQHMSHYAQNLVRTRSDLELVGLDTFLTWQDPQRDVTHALAVLDKPRTLALLAGQLQGQAEDCARLFEAAKAAADAPGLIKAREQRERIEEELLVQAVLSGAAPGAIPRPTPADIAAELRRTCAALPGLDRFVAQAALDLGADLPKGLRVLMDRFTFADTPFCGTFSGYLEQALAVQLAALAQARILDKTRVAGTIHDADLGGGLDQALGSQGVVSGVVFDLGEDVKVTLKVTTASGEELGTGAVTIPAALVRKAGLKLVPDNYLEARQNLAICDAQVRASKLQVKLAMDHGPGGIYRKGERFHLFLKANLPCYVKVIYHEVDGSQVLVYPNEYHPDGRLERDRLYQIPADDDHFTLDVAEPFGAEMMKVIASTEPIPMDTGAHYDNGLSEVKEDLKSLLGRTRGLALRKAEAQYAEATVVVNTMAAAKQPAQRF